MNLTALEAFSDNYIWMIDDREHAIVADPGKLGPVEAALGARRLELPGILLTRHRADAVGKVDVLPSRCAARSAFVHRDDPLPSIDFR